MLYKNIKKFYTAIYLRLSREDGDKTESNSIRNQRELLSDFIKKQSDMEMVDEYIDDGYSGTNFDRPGFQRMIEDAKKGKVNCIIVKDLSRLGRNYIETGKYLEQVFPFMGIRFVSVTDHYDSAKESSDSDQFIIPFKNLINDAYCKDISTKIRSQLDVKRKKGQFIGSFAAYGYLKDPKNKNHLIIDEYAAEIVRMIFKLKLEGHNAEHIAMQLNEMGVLTPMDYKRKCGTNYYSGFRSSKNAKWSVTSVRRILKDQSYTGMMIQGKTRKINHKVNSIIPIEEENWICVANTHEAIIGERVFEDVQKLLKMDTRTSPKQENVYLFSGLLRCGDCGQNMVRRETSKKGKKYYYYHCTTYKNKCGCSSHLISEEKIKKIMLGLVQSQMGLLVEAKKILLEIDNLPLERFSVKILEKQLQELKDEINRYQNLKTKLYMDYTEQVVSKEEYKVLNERFSEKQHIAEEAFAELMKKKGNMANIKTELYPWMESFKQYGKIEGLDRKLLVSLVEEIVVYSKDKIKVVFKHQDEICMLMQAVEYKKQNIYGEVAKV